MSDDDLIFTTDQVIATFSPSIRDEFGCKSGAHEWRPFQAGPGLRMRMCPTCQKVEKV